MLSEIEPWQFDEWMAYRIIEPDANQRLRKILKRGLSCLCNIMKIGGQQIEPNDLDIVAEKADEIEKSITGGQLFAMMKAAYGG